MRQSGRFAVLAVDQRRIKAELERVEGVPVEALEACDTLIAVLEGLRDYCDSIEVLRASWVPFPGAKEASR